MKRILKFHLLLVALLFAPPFHSYAQQPSKVENAVKEIVSKYEKTQGVSSMTAVKGGGLEMMKMMFKKQFGKEFMKGVTSMTLIDYSDASAETCAALHKDLDVFLSLLQEFDLSKEKQFSKNEYVRCFAAAVDSKRISDFVVAMEEGDTKMMMYMAGTIVID